MTTAWFQCLSGASGDMLLGALVDAGAPLNSIQTAIDSVGVDPIDVVIEPVTRGGVAATKVHVRAEPSKVVRTWGNVRGLLESATLDEPVRRRALDVFERLAHAEARAHRTAPEQVHFHEVGALDAVADVVGVSAALHALGVTEAVSSAVTLGSGMVRTEHGLLHVPGPAVVALLSEVGAPVLGSDVPYELCTPTGAALLASVVNSWGPLPPMRVTASGYGAGTRELDELPNVVRVVLGDRIELSVDLSVSTHPQSREASDTSMLEALVIEANVDDLDPRLWPAVLGRLLDAGASDAWLVPIIMKKGRPAHTLSVLVDQAGADAVRRVIFTETSSIGLRETAVGKRALDRTEDSVDVGGEKVRVKIARLDGVVVNVQPEYDDVAAAAAALDLPVKAVLASAMAAALAAGLGTQTRSTSARGPHGAGPEGAA